MIGRERFFAVPFGIIIDDQLERIQHRDAPLAFFVEHFALRVFEHAQLDP